MQLCRAECLALQIPMVPVPTGGNASGGWTDVSGLHVHTAVEQQSWPRAASPLRAARLQPYLHGYVLTLLGSEGHCIQATRGAWKF